MRRFVSFGPALVVLLTALTTLIAAPAAVRAIGYAGAEANVQLARQTLDQEDILDRINRQVRAIADTVSPSVVHIATLDRNRRGMMRVGTGSGWVFDNQGHIVTNSHVVRGARNIVVNFQDGRQVEATIVGRDPATDIAVLKVDTSEGLFPAERATDERLHQGDRVYAFGSPFGFKFSMSEGIVSGLGRDPAMVIGQGGYTNFIQTDAAVNPGNSGGPLVNVRGRVVGMNVAIATGTNSSGAPVEGGQSSGISFAIPLETIEFVVSQLIESGVVVKGFLGISHPSSDDQNDRLLVGSNYIGRGVMITDVSPQGPAQKAGLRAGDIITAFNSEPITSVPVLRSAITNSPAGTKAEIHVWRAGNNLLFNPTLATLPPTPVEQREAVEALGRYGVVNLAETNDGRIVITDLLNNSQALRDGLRPGYIITRIGDQDISSLDGLRIALAQAGLGQGRNVSMTALPSADSPDSEALNLSVRGN